MSETIIPILHVLTKPERILSNQLRQKTQEVMVLHDANSRLITYLIERASLEGSCGNELIDAEAISREAVATLKFLGYNYNPMTGMCEFITS